MARDEVGRGGWRRGWGSGGGGGWKEKETGK